MAECELLSECSRFFTLKLSRLPCSAQIYKIRYCYGNKTLCARYLVCISLCKEQVPMDLFPNHAGKARAFIACG